MKTIRWVLALAVFSCTTAWADGWVRCADEGGACRFDGNRKVQYGEGSKWFVRNYEGSATCNKNAFGGDPSPGKAKHCRFQSSAQPIGYLPAPPQWANCAAEGSMCRFNGTRKVAFGSGSTWVMDSFVGAIECSTGVFGDPAPGKRKECRYLAGGGSGGGTPLPQAAPAAKASWINCALEGKACRFDGTRRVVFGKGQQVATKVFTNGVMCTRENFGDPAPGVVKQCAYESVTVR